jgi:hypothetical protein
MASDRPGLQFWDFLAINLGALCYRQALASSNLPTKTGRSGMGVEGQKVRGVPNHGDREYIENFFSPKVFLVDQFTWGPLQH